MKKSFLVVGLIVVVILVVVVAMTRPSVSSSTGAVAEAVTDGTNSKSVVVTYTDKGFSPTVVQVQRGASIDFLNMSNKALRIAPVKNPGDATSAYLGFESSRSIARGESFGVSVTKAGIWGYKDLNSPKVVGIVIVE